MTLYSIKSSMSKQKITQITYFAFAAFFIVAAVVILQSFLFGLLWSAVMVVSIWPLYERSTGGDGSLRRVPVGLRAGLASVLFAVVFIGPMAYGVYELANAYSAGSNYFTSNSVQGVVAPPVFFQYLPFADKVSTFWQDNIGSSSGMIDIINRLSNGKLLAYIPTLWSQIMGKMLTAFVMLVSFYFMLKHGAAVKNQYATVLSHWMGERGVRHVDSAIEALRGTINGVVLIGALEGLILAVPLVMGGVSSGLLIGLTAGLLGVIPLLMPILILPCLAYLYLDGQTTWAFVGLVTLVLVWFVFENVIKPQIIGQRVRINAYLILMAMIGGLQLTGLLGLFIGPAFVAVAIGVLQDLVKNSANEAHEVTLDQVKPDEAKRTYSVNPDPVPRADLAITPVGNMLHPPVG